jgi:hypothetical protein
MRVSRADQGTGFETVGRGGKLSATTAMNGITESPELKEDDEVVEEGDESVSHAEEGGESASTGEGEFTISPSS